MHTIDDLGVLVIVCTSVLAAILLFIAMMLSTIYELMEKQK